jgi:hypothetical protein
MTDVMSFTLLINQSVPFDLFISQSFDLDLEL